MLLELQIKNFAIIEKQEISFSSGLNVITGETGAGKSIIIQSLELLLGAKLKQEYMRDGADEMTITAVFELNDQLIAELPEEISSNLNNNKELLISRICQRNGRGKAYINGNIVTLSILEHVAQKFLNLCSQAAFVRLLDPSYHLNYLDLYANNSVLKQEYQAKFTELSSLRHKLKELSENSAKLQVQKLWYQQILEDLEQLNPTQSSRNELTEKISTLSQSEKLTTLFLDVKQLFYDGGGIDNTLSKISNKLLEAKKIDKNFDENYEEFQDLWSKLGVLQTNIENKFLSATFDEEEIEELRSKLSDIAKFERKYKTDCLGLQGLVCEAKTKLPELDDSEPVVDKLKKAITDLESQVINLGQKLSETRKKAITKLSKECQTELSELSMKSSILDFSFKPTEPTSLGIESGEFMFTANKGEGLKPLRSIASGGELSRLTLVLKKLVTDHSGTSVLVFDEVDTGVSGSVARAVGRKLKELSTDSQVICITHIPQVASLADRHLYVAKQTSANTNKASKSELRTTSLIKVLKDSDRIEEIARMLSGEVVTDNARKTAIELVGERVQ